MTKLSTSVFALATIFSIGGALAADLKGNRSDPTSAEYTAPERFSFTGFYVGVQGGYGIANHTTSRKLTESFAATQSNCWGNTSISGKHLGDNGNSDPSDDKTYPWEVFGGIAVQNMTKEDCQEHQEDHVSGSATYEGVTVLHEHGYDAAVPAHDVVTRSKFDDSDSGAVGGIIIGVDKQFGRLVAGVFGEYNMADLVDHDGDWAVGARLGYLLSPRLLAYGLVGYGQADYDLATYSGWKFGGGLEYALTENLFIGSKYAYATYDSETLVNTPSLVVEDEFDEHRILVDLKLKLNGGLLGE